MTYVTENKRKPYLLFYLLSGLYVAAVTLFLSDYNHLPSIGGEIGSRLTLNEAIFFFVAVLLLGAVLFYLGFRRFRAKPNWALLACCLLTGLLGVIAIAVFPNESEFPGGYVYFLSAERRVIFVMMSLTLGLSLYLILALFPRCFRGSWRFDFFCYYAIAYALIALIASFFLNHEAYLSFFKGAGTGAHLYSFLGNKNGYSRVLLLGSIASSMLYLHQKKWWWIALFALLGTAIIPSECRASLLCIIIFTLGFVPLVLIRMLKTRKKTAIVLLSLFAIAVFCVLLFGSLSLLPQALQTLWDGSIKAIVTNSTDTLKARTVLWREIIRLLFEDPSQCRYLIGMNDRNFAAFFVYYLNYARLGSAHNGFMEAFAAGGFPRLLFEVCLHAFLIYLLICRLLRGEKAIAIGFMLFEAVLLMLMSVESLGFVTTQNTAFFGDYLLLLFVPNLIYFIQNKEKADHLDELRPLAGAQMKFSFRKNVPLFLFMTSIALFGVGGGLAAYGFAHLDGYSPYLIGGVSAIIIAVILCLYALGPVKKKTVITICIMAVVSFLMPLSIGLSLMADSALSAAIFGFIESVALLLSALILMNGGYLPSIAPSWDEMETLMDSKAYRHLSAKR